MNTRHDDDYNFVFKIILLGDTSVGKTHLLSRYIKGQLPRSKFPTIGVEFATKPVPLKTGGTVRVQIWDTGKWSNTDIHFISWKSWLNTQLVSTRNLFYPFQKDR